MSEFGALEVLGCDSESLEQYLSQDGAFGVHPHQLKGEGWVAGIPTALALFHIQELTLHGLWKVTGRQISGGTQIATVEPVGTFPPLEEPYWQDLLVFKETPDADGYVGYAYPQGLDSAKTRALVSLFWDAKHPALPGTAGGASGQGEPRPYCHTQGRHPFSVQLKNTCEVRSASVITRNTMWLIVASQTRL